MLGDSSGRRRGTREPRKNAVVAGRSENGRASNASRRGDRFARRILAALFLLVLFTCFSIWVALDELDVFRIERNMRMTQSTGGNAELHRELKSLAQLRPGSTNPVIIATAGSWHYRDLLLNFACNMHSLSISNYLILSMDRKINDFLIGRGLPAFLLDSANLTEFDQDALVTFGSPEFVALSRQKARMVGIMLDGGFDVLFSDADVVWFDNPVDLMYDIATRREADLVIQSDAKEAEDTAINYNINSGFYLAKTTPPLRAAFRGVQAFESTNKLSEQKAFNAVFCGAFKETTSGPGQRVGSDDCIYSKKFTAKAAVLDLDRFPNGRSLKWGADGQAARPTRDAELIFHANYLFDASSKLRVLKRVGLWQYSPPKKVVERSGAVRCKFMAGQQKILSSS